MSGESVINMVAGGVYALLLLAGTVVSVALWVRLRTSPGRWTVRAGRLIRRPISAEDSFFVIALLICTVLVASTLQPTMGLDPYGVGPHDVIILSVALHWSTLLVLTVLLRLRGLAWKRVFGTGLFRLGGDLWRGLIAYLAMLPVVFVCSVAYRFVLQFAGMELEIQDVARILTDDVPPLIHVYLLFVAVVLGPIAEELLFRGMLFPILARRIGVMESLWVVSVLFGAVHVHLPSFLPLCMVSIAFCMAYVYSGSIAVPIAMHALFNGVNLMLYPMLRGE